MKVIFVTSEVTYVPQNCLFFFNEVLRNNPSNISGLIIIKNNSLDLLPKAMWLYALGCKNFACCLIHNIVELPLEKRGRLFKKNSLPVLKVKNINDPKIISWIKRNKIDLIINIRTRSIFKEDILSSTKFGCINIHHGLLPKYRGIFCDLYALSENRPAGITIHRMSKKIDDGEIIYTKEVSNNNEKNYINYLSTTGSEEATLVRNLIKYIEKYKSLPKGINNYDANFVITKTPNRNKIREMQKGGMIL